MFDMIYRFVSRMLQAILICVVIVAVVWAAGMAVVAIQEPEYNWLWPVARLILFIGIAAGLIEIWDP